MVDQANVYVRNKLDGNIQATRYCLPGDNRDLDIFITNGNQEMVYLIKGETYLVITPSNGVNVSTCPFLVSNEKLLSWDPVDDHWRVEIRENTLRPEAPTTVNIDIGEDE